MKPPVRCWICALLAALCAGCGGGDAPAPVAVPRVIEFYGDSLTFGSIAGPDGTLTRLAVPPVRRAQELLGASALCVDLSLPGATDDFDLAVERTADALGTGFVDALGRSYFPGINIATFTEADKQRLVDDIDADLAISGAIVPLLPSTSRKAVALAQSLFAELNRRIARTPAAELKHTRVSVPTFVKARLALAVLMGKTS